MKICNVIVRSHKDDLFSISHNGNEIDIYIPLGDNAGIVSTNAWELLEKRQINLSTTTADLLNLAISVYTSDQIISRTDNGFQGWSRHIRLFFPVEDISLWNSVKSDLENLLSFLSGDRWELGFRSKTVTPTVPPSQTRIFQISKVCLLSGGLDSLIGAIDLLENNQKVAFVSHYKRGSESKAQKLVYGVLEKKYGQDSFEKYRFYVQPNQEHADTKKEETSRARSFLFLALGICIATANDSSVDLIVPENGLISLNVPLTGTRLSSHSTRTTHPHYISVFQKVLLGLGIQNSIVNPYRFKTKGEMMLECKNQQVLSSACPETLSCSHADISRFVPGSKAGIHCGYCVPCIIRQAAELAAGGSQTTYARNIRSNPPSAKKGKGRDLRAFKMALTEIQGEPRHSLILRMLKPGPLPVASHSELNQYLDAFLNGMDEVQNFLR